MSAILASSSALLSMVPDQMDAVLAWQDDLRPIVEAGPAGRGARIAALAAARGVPEKTVRKKFDLYIKDGLSGLVNRRRNPALWRSQGAIGLPEEDQQLVKQWCECWQRSSEAAIHALRRAWMQQKVPREAADRGLTVPVTTQPIDIATGFPEGWSVRNLMRYAPTTYELKATRIGRSAAAAHRPLVYTSRRELYVGQYRMWDDMWHDHEVVDLDQRRRGRPLEFHGLDLASGCKIAWGMRTRTQREDGSHEGLEGGDFRFLIASHYATAGYHPRGTTEIMEHGTANLSDAIEQILSDATGGAIKFARGGMEGAAAHAGQYAGRSKGNFRFKAALESLGNLLHNELAALPGQVGKDRQHAPEEMHSGGRLIDSATGRALAAIGRQKHADALLAAISQLPADRIEWLAWPLRTIQQFRLIAEEVYARINDRRDHDLEGWDERMTWCERSGKMRRLSPVEVYRPASGAMRPLDMDAIALILAGGDGLEKLAVERTTRSGMITLNDGEISGDEIRFAADELSEREKYLTILNPFDATRLFVFSATGGFLGTLPRIHSVSRADTEAIHRAMGAAAKRENQLLQPLRMRHARAARERAAMHENNARVLGGSEAGPSRMPDADDLAAATERATDAPAPAATDGEDADDLARQIGDLC